MPDPLSLNLVHLKPSETIAISAETKRRRAAGEEVFDLSVGEPDFDTPPLVAQAGIQAIQKGMTHYPPNPGIPELRAAVARHLSGLSNGRPVNADNILISSGSKHSLFNACFTLFGPNDQVLIPAPAWVSYPQIIHLSRAEPVLVPGDIEWGLKVSARDLDRHSTTRTKGLVICSPCNPTGAVYTLAELRAIAEWARKHEIWVVADEIYRHIYYGGTVAPSFLDLPDELLERTVVICGASKAYAMTGWRIGAALAPPHVFKGMAALQSHTTTGANHPAQWAAATAFGEPKVEADLAHMVSAFRGRRDRVVERFRREAPGVEFVEPVGAFYFFFRVDGLPGLEGGGTAFCERLMKEEGVALVPGGAFGDDRWVRLSYACADKELDAGVGRILQMIGRLSAARAA